jgi:dihydroxy-acid dehydratase
VHLDISVRLPDSASAAVGGPLALVRDGDVVALDARAGTVDMLVSDDELAIRRKALMPVPPRHTRGYAAMYVERVLQADEGCDFDFLVGRSLRPDDEPEAIFEGWVGGW